MPKPPQIAEPVAYAQAAAAMLWSYDTRTTSRDQQLAGMKAWLTSETKYADWSSLTAQVPDPVLWSRMADQDQYATAIVDEAHYPSAFKQALADDPSAITEAYIYAVTVTGKQQIAWKKGGGGSEDRLDHPRSAVPPEPDCTLVCHRSQRRAVTRAEPLKIGGATPRGFLRLPPRGQAVRRRRRGGLCLGPRQGHR
ncbi:hypothetical protein QBA38_12120 [Streptomyces stelliscabiei]|uniref:hypothetical protein n=1 Tax=Streptomyces stelliscabiei TaxID=146820 RepID=UPI002FF1A809